MNLEFRLISATIFCLTDVCSVHILAMVIRQTLEHQYTNFDDRRICHLRA